MKTAAWHRIVKPLLTDEWALHKKLAYLKPVGWTLYGVDIESRTSHTGFYLRRVQMPLVVPREVLDLSYSERHGGSTHFYDEKEDDIPAIVAEAMALVREAARTTTIVPDAGPGPHSYNTMEVIAYGCFLEGDPRRAAEMLGRVALRSSSERTWVVEMAERATRIRSLLLKERHSEVREQLEAWRRQTLDVLGIDSGSGF